MGLEELPSRTLPSFEIGGEGQPPSIDVGSSLRKREGEMAERLGELCGVLPVGRGAPPPRCCLEQVLDGRAWGKQVEFQSVDLVAPGAELGS